MFMIEPGDLLSSTFAGETDKTKMSQHARQYVDSALVRLEHRFYQKFPSKTGDQLKEIGAREAFLDKAVQMVRASQQSAYNSSGDINNWDALIGIPNLAYYSMPDKTDQNKKVTLIVNALQNTGISSEAVNEVIWRWNERYKKLGPPTLYEEPPKGQNATIQGFRSIISDPQGYGMMSDPFVQNSAGYRDPDNPMKPTMPQAIRG